jgi:hypothetical protein
MSIYSSIDGRESDEDFPDPRDLLTISTVPAQSASPPIEHQSSEGLNPRPKEKDKGKLRETWRFFLLTHDGHLQLQLPE